MRRYYRLDAEEIDNLTLSQIVLLLSAIPQLLAMEAAISVPYINKAFVGTKHGEKIEIPSFWTDEVTVDEWKETAHRRGLKFPEENEDG